MIISDKHRFVWLDTPKAASRAIEAYLLDKCTDAYNVGGAHSTHIPDRCADYDKVAFVRNPYDRAVSIWYATTRQIENRYNIPPGIYQGEFIDFMVWLNNTKHTRPLFMTQYEFLKDTGARTLLYETLDDPDICHVFGDSFYFNCCDVPRENTAEQKAMDWGTPPKPEWFNLVSQLSGKLVYKYFRDDFIQYGYEKAF